MTLRIERAEEIIAGEVRDCASGQTVGVVLASEASTIVDAEAEKADARKET